jgi:hypothetical protein
MNVVVKQRNEKTHDFYRNECLERRNEIVEESYFIWTNDVPLLLNLVA